MTVLPSEDPDDLVVAAPAAAVVVLPVLPRYPMMHCRPCCCRTPQGKRSSRLPELPQWLF
jgi:hypothetical protein